MSLFGLLKPAWARGATGWEAIAAAFVTSEVGKDKPDFAGFTKLIKDMSAAERGKAWQRLGDAYKEKGNARLARQCYVEAVFSDPDSASPAWAGIDLPAGMAGADPLRSRLSSLPRRAISGDRPDNASLAAALRRLVGEPGRQ